MILVTNSIVYPWTIVIHARNTTKSKKCWMEMAVLSKITTMMAPRRFEVIALSAPTMLIEILNIARL